MTDATDGQMTKADVLERIRASFASWKATAGAIPDEAMSQPLLYRGWSGKDFLAHVRSTPSMNASYWATKSTTTFPSRTIRTRITSPRALSEMSNSTRTVPGNP